MKSIFRPCILQFIGFVAVILYLFLLLKGSFSQINELESKIVYSDKLVNLFYQSYIYEGEKVDSDLKLIDSNGYSLSVSDIITDSSKLFVFLNSPYCNTCIDKLVNSIEESAVLLDFSDVVYVIKSTQAKDLTLIKKRYPIINNIYGISSNSFIDEMEDLKTPTMFIVTDSLFVDCVFIYDKSFLNEAINKYLRIINKRFYDNSRAKSIKN